jgi:rSAM/selenodomain-associated transferase 2
MRFSIIIPTLNEAENITELILHLRLHGGDAVSEIIVADGGSTDGTPELAANQGAVVIPCDKGRALQMNAGAKAATSNILYFVHADTRPPVDFLTHIERALVAGWPMGCFRYKFDSPNLMMRINSWFTRFYFMFCQGGDKTFFIKRELFWQMGGYDERYVIMEEYDFLRRAKRAGFSFYIMPASGIVSARKYEGRSWLRVQLANLVVFNAWQWNLVQPERLKILYREMLG